MQSYLVYLWLFGMALWLWLYIVHLLRHGDQLRILYIIGIVTNYPDTADAWVDKEAIRRHMNWPSRRSSQLTARLRKLHCLGFIEQRECFQGLQYRLTRLS